MGKFLKEILERQIQLASQVTKAANESALNTHECNGCTLIKPKTENLAELIRSIAQQTIEYDRPILRIMDEVEKLLGKALTLVLKCGTTKRLINDRDDDDAFMKFSRDLDNCVEDVKWLRHLYKFSYDRVVYSSPPIAREEGALAMIWVCIKELYESSQCFQLLAAQDLLSLTVNLGNNPRVKELIIEEGGVLPLLKLLKDGNIEEQEAAAAIIESLPHNLESVELLIDAGAFPVFAKILKVSPMKVQAKVISAIGNLTDIHQKCQDICIQNNIIRLLIDHISSEMIQEHVQNFIPINKATSVLAIVRASSHLEKAKAIGYDDNQDQKNSSVSLPCENLTNRQLEDPDTKAYLKAMAASTLRQLVKHNTAICRIIVESKALMCFITLLAEGRTDVQYHSIMVLRNITAIAEHDSDLRRSVFKPSSPPWKTLIGNMIRILGSPVSPKHIILLCVQTIGNLARTFRVAEARIITPLVNFVDHKTESTLELCRESLIALSKLTCEENHLHVDHSKEIVRNGGLSRIIEVVYFAERSVQELGIVLFCYVAMDVPECDELGRIEALKVLQRVFKRGLTKKEEISALVKHAKSRLENYQARKEADDRRRKFYF